MGTGGFFTEKIPVRNRAFLYGDAVKAYFFVRRSKLIMAEECYFFLMASMRKLRMSIPLNYTLEFFEKILGDHVASRGVSDAIVQLMVFRNADAAELEKSEVSYYIQVDETPDVLAIRGEIEMDLLKEITVNSHFLSSIRVHSAENIYAEIYAAENDLDDVVLLNHHKRIARSISGNLLFLEADVLKIPNQSEGAYISPLLENFVTFLHRNSLVEIRETEMMAFESQKAEEILLISDEKGIFAVRQIRKKTFGNHRFAALLQKWQENFGGN